MTFIINLLLFILILGFIVFVHEFGHFIWAKICGVYVYEFALGMGPKLLSKQGKETEYTIRAIPLGGFCALAGEDVDDDDKRKIPKNRRLQDKKPWQRFLIMFFGAGNNFISAFIILFFIALIWGGTTMDPVITKVSKKSPAYEAGLESKDRILKINKNKIVTSDDVTLYLAVSNPKVKNKFKVEKEDGSVKTYEIKPEKKTVKGKDSYVYGIMIKQKPTHGFVNSLSYMCKKGKSIFKQMWVTVSYLFTGRIKLSQLSGPVGIYSIVGEQKKAGISNLLYLVAFLSINVGFINLLPLPAFDGGHILFILIEIIRRKPVSPELEAKIHTAGFILLLLLMVIVTINDILNLT
ncbi:MAG: RIP metalloprotease RseP [Bacilli bacterium]|nr:RIP metalloprotease RseP [Bacilli bacterium]